MNEGTLYIVEILAEILDKVESQGINIKDICGEVEGLKEGRIRMEGKIDSISNQIGDLLGGFKELKEEVRSFDEKISLMNLKLSRIEENIDENELEDYYVLSQNCYCNWDVLDDLTRKFIPVAEYLFSKLQKFQDADFSPVILELCRAIENEFLTKIFRKYSLKLIDERGRNLDRFLLLDQANQETRIFAKAIKKAVRTRNPEYTLGQMNTILSLLMLEEKVNNSPLLQDFSSYISNEYDAARLLHTDYIRKINGVVNDFRNPSAHPEFMDLSKAQECKDIMPDRIDYLLDCITA
jgi:hypothetical protein